MNRSITEYLEVGRADVREELKLQWDVVKGVKNLKYFGSTVGSNGEWEEKVRRRIHADWMSLKKVFRAECDRKLS